METREENISIEETGPNKISRVFLDTLSEKGLTVEEITSSNKIPVWIINAILKDDIEKLGKEKASAIGFLHKLEQFIGAEKDLLVTAAFPPPPPPVHATKNNAKQKKEVVKPADPKEKAAYTENLVPIFFWIILILGIPALLFFGIYNKMAIDQAHSTNPVLNTQQDTQTITPEVIPANASITVKLAVDESAWIRVTIDGSAVEEITLEPGMQKVYTAASSIKIFTGNAPVIRANYAGERWEKLYAGSKRVITWELTKANPEPVVTGASPDESTAVKKPYNPPASPAAVTQ